MKKIFISLLALGIINSANALDLQVLTGDTRLACEAMLCLASPTKPSECSNALAKFFSIKFKKPWKTIQARQNFLNLCPVDSADSEMLKYKNQILANLDSDCSVTTLNNRIEKKVLRIERVCRSSGAGNGYSCVDVKIYGYRINPQPTNSCRLLASSAYTDYHLKYTCDGKFYEKEDWDRGYTLKEVSKEIYESLPENERQQSRKRKLKGKFSIVYYQKVGIKKDCWVNEKK